MSSELRTKPFLFNELPHIFSNTRSMFKSLASEAIAADDSILLISLEIIVSFSINTETRN